MKARWTICGVLLTVAAEVLAGHVHQVQAFLDARHEGLHVVGQR